MGSPEFRQPTEQPETKAARKLEYRSQSVDWSLSTSGSNKLVLQTAAADERIHVAEVSFKYEQTTIPNDTISSQVKMENPVDGTDYWRTYFDPTVQLRFQFTPHIVLPENGELLLYGNNYNSSTVDMGVAWNYWIEEV